MMAADRVIGNGGWPRWMDYRVTFGTEQALHRNRPGLVNLFVQRLEDLLLGAVIHAIGECRRRRRASSSPLLVSHASDVVRRGGWSRSVPKRVTKYRAALAAGRAGHQDRNCGHSSSNWK